MNCLSVQKCKILGVIQDIFYVLWLRTIVLLLFKLCNGCHTAAVLNRRDFDSISQGLRETKNRSEILKNSISQQKKTLEISFNGTIGHKSFKYRDKKTHNLILPILGLEKVESHCPILLDVMIRNPIL
jgi:hypothetical protein